MTSNVWIFLISAINFQTTITGSHFQVRSGWNWLKFFFRYKDLLPPSLRLEVDGTGVSFFFRYKDLLPPSLRLEVDGTGLSFFIDIRIYCRHL